MRTENRVPPRSGFRWLFFLVLLGAIAAILFKWTTQPLTEKGELTKDELPQTESAFAPQESETIVLEEQKVAEPEVRVVPKPLNMQSAKEPLPESLSESKQEPSQEEVARQLALAACQGDETALDKLAALTKAANVIRASKQDSFKTSQERDAFTVELFAPIRAAFDLITEEAAKGNQNALDALARGAQTKGLTGFAVAGLGTLAGQGNEGALEALLLPNEFGLLKSTTVSALQPAAEAGNQKAIDTLAAVVADDKVRPLWWLASCGLEKAAASGNSVAIDALIKILNSGGPSERRKAVSGLSQAAANQNSKAAEALRAAGEE